MHSKSSNLKSFDYDPLSKVLAVQFHDGTRYAYEGVPALVYDSLKRSSSHGKFFAKHIRGTFTTIKLK